MGKNTEELLKLSQRYGKNEKELLKENPSLVNLYVFSDQRENLLEWYSMKNGAKLLQVGADSGALTGLFLRKGLTVTVLDRDETDLEFVRTRWNAGRQGSGKLCTVCGDLNGLPQDDRFDYIFFDGTLEGKEDVQAAKKHLQDGGKLIVAADNPYGVRYWAGAGKRDNAIAERKLEKLLNGEEDGTVYHYYPEPERLLPNFIYSEDRLPERGELSRIITAYDYPKYTVINVAERYEKVIEDGLFPQFADAFLFIWSRKQ
jgi:SAM-dependent methyltransferase